MIEKKRVTRETNVTASINIYGSGLSNINTGIGFFDHMLTSFSKHSFIDFNIECIGDTNVDYHHSIEDCGIVIGELIKSSIYPVCGIERFGFCSMLMDDACVECSIDISNRAFFVFDLPLSNRILASANFDCELVEEFFKALTFNANICAHVIFKRGNNLHHIMEATFKSFAVALRRALVKNNTDIIPSTKGVL